MEPDVSLTFKSHVDSLFCHQTPPPEDSTTFKIAPPTMGLRDFANYLAEDLIISESLLTFLELMIGARPPVDYPVFITLWGA